MFDLKKIDINRIADKANFSRNTTEKVLRLYSILKFIDQSEISNMLVLKGGTAINLFLLDLPRLSVDIDLDFALPLNRDEMLKKREYIDMIIRDYMADEGYFLSDKSKFVHTLDSYVYSYSTLSGGKDILKIEINYSDRVHVLKPTKTVSTNKLERNVMVSRLADEELIGSKINALLVRTTPRDVYDVFTLFKNGNIKNEELIKKIAIFYVCLGSQIPVDINVLLIEAIKKIDNLNFQKVKETLIPVLHKGIVFNVEEMTAYVSEKIKTFFKLNQTEKKFIDEYNQKNFKPEILFEGFETEDVRNHPMGIWKTK